MLPINKTRFLFTVDILFYLTFFHNADICIFAKTTAALFNNIFKQGKLHYHHVHEICDQSDLAILNADVLVYNLYQ